MTVLPELCLAIFASLLFYLVPIQVLAALTLQLFQIHPGNVHQVAIPILALFVSAGYGLTKLLARYGRSGCLLATSLTVVSLIDALPHLPNLGYDRYCCSTLEYVGLVPFALGCALGLISAATTCARKPSDRSPAPVPR